MDLGFQAFGTSIPGWHKPGWHKPGWHKPGSHQPGSHKPGSQERNVAAGQLPDQHPAQTPSSLSLIKITRFQRLSNSPTGPLPR